MTEVGGIRVDDQGGIHIPTHLMPLLNNWVGRLQREVNKPIDVPDVAIGYMMAMNHLVETMEKGEHKVSTDTLYDMLKDNAIRAFEAGRKRQDDDMVGDTYD
jgi:hypothetical protein